MSNAGPIRYGIIGAGMMGWEHINNINLLKREGGNVSVTMLCDPDAKMMKGAQKLCEGPVSVYTDFKEAVKDPNVDALVIASPNNHHIDVIREAVKYGKHMMVEKPMCTTLDDCQEVLELLQKYEAYQSGKACFWVGMEYRYIPSIAKLISEVDSGTVGKLRMLSIREHRFPFLRKVGDWNRFAVNTGGTLVEKCCHFFDLMNRITRSMPIRVYASGGQDVNHIEETYADAGTTHSSGQPDITDNAFVIVDFADGTRAMLDLCMFAEVSRYQEEVSATGEKGKVEAFAPVHGSLETDSIVYIGRRNPGKSGSFSATTEYAPPKDIDLEMEQVKVYTDPKLLEAGYHEGSTFFEHEAFINAIEKKIPPTVTATDGALAVAVGYAAELSLREHRPIILADFPLVKAILKQSPAPKL